MKENFFKKYICTYSHSKVYSEDIKDLYKIISLINKIKIKDKIKIIKEINEIKSDRTNIEEKFNTFIDLLSDNERNFMAIPYFILMLSDTFREKYKFIFIDFSRISEKNNILKLDNIINKELTSETITKFYISNTAYSVIYDNILFIQYGNGYKTVTINGFIFLFNNLLINDKGIKNVLHNFNYSIYDTYKSLIDNKKSTYRISKVFMVKYIIFTTLCKKYNKN